MAEIKGTFGQEIVVVDRTEKIKNKTPVNQGKEVLSEAIAREGGEVNEISFWTQTDSSPFLVIGLTNDQIINKLLKRSLNCDLEELGAESTIYRWCEGEFGPALVIAGTDSRGLTYALLEMAERVKNGGIKALEETENLTETPDNQLRGADRFISGPVEDEWFYSQDFWHYYLARLARYRFNRFTLITGFDTAFMSPPYPFFLEVEDYPQVKVTDEVEVDREDNLAQLKEIGQLCHQYGLEFFFSSWQQRPWSANPDLDVGSEDQGLLVEGLPEDSARYTDYCSKGLEKLLNLSTEIDGVQLRVNFESGVGDRNTAEDFWREIIKATERASDGRDRQLKLELRAKGLTDRMIRWGMETGLEVNVPTKYWCESTGLPHHNVQMRRGELDNLDDLNRSRRYSYADLLEKPHFYDMSYRLWAIGTNRIFLWGDPDYARRFAHSTKLGDGVGYHITAPLSLKGGHFFLQEEKWPLFDDPELGDYEWEDERYWFWYLVFGRLGYSSDTDEEVWKRELRARFGPAAVEDILEGYRSSSKILPLITAFHLTRHPCLTNWAELDTGGALFAENNSNPRFGDVTYMTAEPSDPGLFYRIDEYVEDYLKDDLSGKYTPLQVSRWLEEAATQTRGAIDSVEGKSLRREGEYKATRLDFLMLANLGEYHAKKVKAALGLQLYQKTSDGAYLEGAYRYGRSAKESWEQLSSLGSGTYHEDLRFGFGESAGDSGQWKDRLTEMEEDVKKLQALLDEEGIKMEEGETSPVDRLAEPASSLSFFSSLPFLSAQFPEECQTGEDLELSLKVGELERIKDVKLHYRHANQMEGPFEISEAEETAGGYRASVPGEYVTPEWDLLIYFTGIDDGGNGIIFPGLYHPDYPEPYHTIKTREDD